MLKLDVFCKKQRELTERHPSNSNCRKYQWKLVKNFLKTENLCRQKRQEESYLACMGGKTKNPIVGPIFSHNKICNDEQHLSKWIHTKSPHYSRNN